MTPPEDTQPIELEVLKLDPQYGGPEPYKDDAWEEERMAALWCQG